MDKNALCSRLFIFVQKIDRNVQNLCRATEVFDKGLQTVDNVISEAKQSTIAGLERSANNLSNLLDPYGRLSPEMQLAGTDINMRVSDLGIVETKPGVRVKQAEINVSKTGGETGKVAGQKLNGVEQAEVGTDSVGKNNPSKPGESLAYQGGNYSNGKYTGGRTEQELESLALDPAHSGSDRPIDIEKGQHEARVGLELEERG